MNRNIHCWNSSTTLTLTKKSLTIGPLKQNLVRIAQGAWGGGKVQGGKMQGTGARYQCEATGNLRGWNVRGAAGVVIGCEPLKRN